jgi:gliding motility-associated-like protein
MQKRFNSTSIIIAMGLLWGLLSAVASQSQPLNWQWVAQTPTVGPDFADASILAVAVDGAGRTVVAGGFRGTVSFGSTTLTSEGAGDVFVAWLDSAGRYRRVARGRGPGGASAAALAIAPDGTVTLAGSFEGATAGFGGFTVGNSEVSTDPFASDLFVARLDSTGRWLAASAAGGPGYDYLSGLSLDAAGNAVVAGYFTSPTCRFGATALVNASFGFDSFVARLDQSCAWTQAVRIGGPNNDLIQDVAVASDGTAVVTGFFNSAGLPLGPFTLVNDGTPYYGLRGADVFVARLSPAGVWTQAVRAGGPNNDSAYNVVLDAQDNAIIAGHFFSPTIAFGTSRLVNTTPAGEVGDVFIARLSRMGTWTQAVQSSGTGWEEAGWKNALAVDAQGSVVLTGTFNGGPARFGNWLLRSPTASPFDRDIFVAWLDAAGGWTNALVLGGNDLDSEPVLAWRDGDLTLAGTSWNSTIVFGPLRTTHSGGFVARYGKTPPVRPPAALPMVVPTIITPNGDGKNDAFRFQNAPKATWAIRIYNRWGQQVYANPHYAQDWTGGDSPAGQYYYLLERSDGLAPLKGWLEIAR